MRFAVLRKAVEDNFRLFDKARHSDDRLIEAGEEVIPVKRDDQLRLYFLCRFLKELPLCFFICLGQTGDAEEQHIGFDIVQLFFDIVEARADEVCFSSVLHNKVIRAAFFLIPQPCGLHERGVDRLAEIVVQDRRLRMKRGEHCDAESGSFICLIRVKLDELFFRHIAAAGDIQRG